MFILTVVVLCAHIIIVGLSYSPDPFNTQHPSASVANVGCVHQKLNGTSTQEWCLLSQPLLKPAVARHTDRTKEKKELERKCSVASLWKSSTLAVLLQGLEKQSSLSGIRRKTLVSEMGKRRRE